MTSVDVRSRPRNAKSPTSDRELRKGVLFCPVCGHESPIEGAWDVTTVESQREYSCPECGQVVAVR